MEHERDIDVLYHKRCKIYQMEVKKTQPSGQK